MEVGEEAVADGRVRKHEGRDEDSNSDQSQHTSTWPASAKKRPSPDSDVMRTSSIPSGERQPKRPKVGAFRFRQEHSEPLRDADATPSRSKGYKRASSTKPAPSPGGPAPSIFPPRAQSVPLGSENKIPSIDFTAILPSPRRSPSKSVVAVWGAPPPDEERMDVDVDNTSALLHFTNPTCIATPSANPAFRYVVNFATPRGSATHLRPGVPLASPPSPLTPLPPSPPPKCLHDIQSLLANKVNAKIKDNMNNRLEPPVISPMADLNASTDVFPSATHVPNRPSWTTSPSHPASVDPGPSAASQSRLSVPPMSPSKIPELMSLPTASKTENATTDATVVGRLGQARGISYLDLERVENAAMSTSVDPPSSSKRLDSSAISISRPVVGSMRPKRGPSVPYGSKRVTRSVSMKEQRVQDTVIEDVTVEGKAAMTAVAGPSTDVAAMPPPSTAVTSQLRPPKSTGSVISTSRPLMTGKRTSSMSKLPSDTKLKQISLETFVKAKPLAAGNDTTTGGCTAVIGASSRPTASPSKIPLPALPLKRPIMAGRSLSTLSNALDKLVVPPPSRPNTSMGFVKADRTSEGDGFSENGKGKEKAKDDTSLPLGLTPQGSGTFARPTASSLKRTATVTKIGSAAVARMRDRGGVAVRGLGRGRGTIGIFNRAGERASKKTSLPVVVGSPVKGLRVTDSSQELATDEQDTAMQDAPAKSSTGGDERAASQKPSPPAAPKLSDCSDIDLTISPISVGKGKQRAVPPSTLNPASSALHALSESLSCLPQTPTPPKPRVAGTRTGLRSSTATACKDSPIVDRSGIAGPTGNHEVHGSGGTANGSGSVKKSSLKILKRCAIFVDVRTEQGDDAGSLFVDMLKGLGAKIMGRLGQRCTHIVYKNGHPNTLTRYRMLDDPKPCVVGIAWVVECAEKRAKVDEERFKIDVDLINVAGGNSKRRRSMFPKHLIPASPGPDYETPLQMASAVEDDEGAGGIGGSPSQDPDLSIRSREEDDLPPLERARRRRSILPGGQTRLVP